MANELTIDQINILRLYEAAHTLQNNIKVFSSGQGQMAEIGTKANILAFNNALAVLYHLKLNSIKEDYELLLKEPNFKQFDSIFLQEPTEIKEKPKSPIILLGT